MTDVATWVTLHDLQEIKQNLLDNEVCGEDLEHLDDAALLGLGITKMGHRKKLLRIVREQSLPFDQRLVSKRKLLLSFLSTLFRSCQAFDGSLTSRLTSTVVVCRCFSGPEMWTLGDTCDWLATMEMRQYRILFITNSLNGKRLIQLTDSELLLVGVEALGHRKRILRNIKQLLYS